MDAAEVMAGVLFPVHRGNVRLPCHDLHKVIPKFEVQQALSGIPRHGNQLLAFPPSMKQKREQAMREPNGSSKAASAAGRAAKAGAGGVTAGKM